MAKIIKNQIEKLRNEIRRHDYLYYILNQPKISDRQYDKPLAVPKARSDLERLVCFALAMILAFWPWFGVVYLLRRYIQEI
jgi:hypothetical protein